MNETNQTTEVVAEPKRFNNKKKIIAGAATVMVGALLIGGGASLAAWEKTVTGQDVTISAGTFDIERTGTLSWTDVSPDLADGPVEIDPATFLITPGDQLRGTETVNMEFSGENLEADLSARVKALTGDLVAAGLTGNVTLLDHEGTEVANRTLDAETNTPLVHFDAVNKPTGEYTLQVDLDYDKAATTGIGKTALLSSIDLTLTQTR